MNKICPLCGEVEVCGHLPVEFWQEIIKAVDETLIKLFDSKDADDGAD